MNGKEIFQRWYNFSVFYLQLYGATGMYKYKDELELVNNLAQSLISYGEVKIGYITAELKPFSKQQKPDLEFKYKKSNSTLFVTFEIFDNGFHSYNDLLLTAIEYKNFAIDEKNMKFIYATNITIPMKWHEIFFEKNIILIMGVEECNDIKKELLNISRTKEN